jgi:undecaprenyl-diphosphatase
MIMTPVYHITYLQAIVIGLVQGLTELFPISSLGHTVLIPAWLGGTWGLLVRQESRPESPYLAFIVGLHLATAIVLVAYYWRTWVRIVRGLVTSVIQRRIDTDDQRLAWLLVIATIPVGIAGLALEHAFRVLFARPEAAAIFLTINGAILYLGERYRRRGAVNVTRRPVAHAAPSGQAGRADLTPPERAEAAWEDGTDGTDGTDGMDGMDGTATATSADHRLAAVGALSALWIGAAQILALFAGISREGVTMAGGLIRGLNHEDAMRFSFLLSTPVILAAGALKVPDLSGSLGNDIHGQVLVGSIAAAATSLFAVLFLARYFRTRTLTPFAIYCVLAGVLSIIRFAL